jgi:predicted lipid-binding transport protein (Tim44 family)
MISLVLAIGRAFVFAGRMVAKAAFMLGKVLLLVLTLGFLSWRRRRRDKAQRTRDAALMAQGRALDARMAAMEGQGAAAAAPAAPTPASAPAPLAPPQAPAVLE